MPSGVVLATGLLVNALTARTLPLLWAAVLIYVATQAGSMIGQPVNSWLQQQLINRMTGVLQAALIEATGAFPGIAHLDNPARLNEMQLLRDQSPWMPMNIVQFSSQAVRGAVTTIAVLAIIARWSPGIALLILVSTIPFAWAQLQASWSAWQGIVSQAPENRRLQYVFQVALDRSTAQEIRVFDLTPFLLRKYSQYYARVLQILRRAQTRQTRITLATAVAASLGVAIAFGWVVLEGWRREISVGQVAQMGAALFQALVALQMTMPAVASLWTRSSHYAEILKRWIEESAVDEDAQSPYSPSPGVHSISRQAAASVEFRAVGFRYPNGKVALQNVSFRIPDGQTVALIGPNGAGKSTIIKLLLRLYDPSEGVILVDGIPLLHQDRKAYRRQVSVCPQDFGKYQFTVRENITLGQTPPDPERLMSASYIARAEFIDRFPQGYGQELGNLGEQSFELSGGEWQRLAIARAAYRADARLILLDEPTAAVDPEVEREMLTSLLALCRDRTAIIVTHRLSLARQVDRILVVNGGRIEEDGVHDDLMDRHGLYATLFENQSSLYQRVGSQ